MARNPAPRWARTVAAATSGVLAAALLVGCGNVSGGAGPSATDGLPATVSVRVLLPSTGILAFLGENAQRGYELAVEEINEQDFLDGTTLDVEYVDTKSEPQTASQSLSQAAAGSDVSAVLASVSSNEAVATSPLAQQAGLPIVYTQAGSDGVIVGDYTWRATPLMQRYYPLLNSYLEETEAESIGILYSEATATLQEIGTRTLPDMAAEVGIEVTGSVGTQASTQDFSAPISQLLADDPDLVAVLLAGAANPTAMTQLRQAGYDGPAIGNSGASAGNLDPAGQDAAGYVWATDFHADTSVGSSAEFVEAYRAAYDADPINYAAEAYDATWFLARALQEAGSADRTSIREGMDRVAEEPFDGALGEDLPWVDQELQVAGVVVEYTGTGERVLYEGTAPPD